MGKSKKDRETNSKANETRTKKGCYGKKKKKYESGGNSRNPQGNYSNVNNNSSYNTTEQREVSRTKFINDSDNFGNTNHSTGISSNRSNYNDNVKMHESSERIEKTVIEKRPIDSRNNDSRRTDTQKYNDYSSGRYTFTRDHSPSSSESIRPTRKDKPKPAYDVTEFRRSYNKKGSFKNPNNSVTIERYVSSSNRKSFNTKQTGQMPMLKTHKAYDISFTLASVPNERSNRQSWRKTEKNEIETIEYLTEKSKKIELQNDRKDKWLESDTSSKVQFEDLMKDVNLIGKKKEDENRHGRVDKRVSYDSRGRATNTNDGIYNNHDKAGNIAAEEVSEVKEWMIVEYPDHHQERRAFRREFNDEGDVNYVDVLNGNILKVENASWKTGEEFIKVNKGAKKIKYEWRKDPNTDSWVKYNSDTNEILKRGDWKSGSEWAKNSKGKFVERPYKYIRNPNGQWIKVDPSSGKVIDFANTSAISGHEWIPTEKKSRKKLEDRRWKKREYKYVENSNGQWDKIDQETKRKIGKSSKAGWKEGIDYHMDKNNKVSKVRYIWDSKENGPLEKINKKTKEPLNTMWKEGREIVMRNDTVNTTNYAWVPTGKNKWVKINQENGSPLTEQIASNKINLYMASNLSNQPSYATKTTKRIENDKIIQEDLKIQQNNGGLIKNSTTTTKYVK